MVHTRNVLKAGWPLIHGWQATHAVMRAQQPLLPMHLLLKWPLSFQLTVPPDPALPARWLLTSSMTPTTASPSQTGVAGCRRCWRAAAARCTPSRRRTQQHSSWWTTWATSEQQAGMACMHGAPC